jgi:hypothetical protein
MDYEFKLDENGAVSIYDKGDTIPFCFQPNWPSGEAWGTGEAEAWARQLILSLSDDTEELAGDTPSQPTKPRPTV